MKKQQQRQSVEGGQGSGGNVVAALVSFFIPGLGQLIQGRFIAAVFIFLITGALWFVLLGWIGHIVAALDAATYKPKYILGS